MRILHIVQTLDPATGGPPVVATKLAASQMLTGCKVCVCAYKSPESDESVRKYLKSLPEAAKTMPIDYVGKAGRAERFFPKQAKAALSRLIADADFLHIHGVWDPICKAAADVARRTGVPYTICPHGMLDPWAMQQRAWKKRLALAMGYRRMLNSAAFLHCLNQDEARLIKPLGLTSPTRIVPNGIFAEDFADLPSVGSFSAKHPELLGNRYVLFLSRLHYKKGLDYLAEAFAQIASKIPDVRLVVAGPDGGERSAFEEHIARLSIADRVHLVGPLYGQDKLEALVGASCFCLPSRQEGFSIAITEALAVGRPVVISENCHFPEVATVGAGLVVPLDSGSVADAVTRVLTDREQSRRMGEAGRKLVFERYTWPKIAEQMTDLYRQALAPSTS